MFRKLFGKKPNKESVYEAKKLELPVVSREYTENKSNIRYEKIDNVWKNKSRKKEETAVIMCAGDLMCEPAMSEAVFYNGKYCFDSCFKYVRNVFAESDFAIANLETMVTEKVPYAHEIHRIDGRYHCNAPVQYLEALRYAGFDAFALANNHNADAGYEGLLDTLTNIDVHGFMRTGMFSNAEETRYLLVNINGIKVAFISYTMHINRDLDKKIFTKEGCNVLINRYDKGKTKNDITEARKNGAEFVVCYMHFLGNEYSHEVTERQQKVARELAELGVDCIMGSHTHSLQHYDVIDTSDGRKVPAVYSLGNFITSDNTSMITRYNIIYKLELKKEAGRVVIAKDSYIPCRIVEHTLKSGFVIFPTQSKWRQERPSQLLEDAQEKIKDVIGNSLLLDEKKEDGGEIFGNLPLHIKRELTLRKICSILNIAVPEKYKKIENQSISYITARYTWVRKGCIYFSRYLGTTEEKDARLAYKKGASIIFSSKQLYLEDGSPLPCIVVDSPERSFYSVNRWLCQLYSAKIIAITSSVGKTTTKEMLYHVVADSFNTLKNSGNANTYAAISDTIQKLKPENEIYIQEVCGFSPGWVKGGGYMLNPNACLITNVGYPHVDLYGSIEKILEDKMSLVDNLSDDGVAFLNYDDELIRSYEVNKPVISFAIYNKEADYYATDIIYGDGVIDFAINFVDDEKTKSIPARIHMYGEYNVINALAAFAIGRWLGIAEERIVKALESYRSEGMRQNVCNIGGYHLYMDCYNSAPNSVIGSVHSLALMKPENNGRKIVVFGDIPRLGALSEEIHKQVGESLSSEEIDVYFCYGQYAKNTAEELKKANHEVYHTLKRDELNAWLGDYISRDDIILFKAGHPMALAKTADQIFGTSFHITDGDVLLENSHYIDGTNFVARWIDGVVEIQKNKTEITKVIIPEILDGSPVGRIGKEAFQNSKVKQIVIPDSIYNIGFAAFYKCLKLQDIMLGSGLKVIERSAFNTCTALEEIRLPHGTIEIGEKAFYMCSLLRQIFIPDTVGHIGENAFNGCKNLTIVCNENSYAEAYAKKNGIKVAYKI